MVRQGPLQNDAGATCSNRVQRIVQQRRCQAPEHGPAANRCDWSCPFSAATCTPIFLGNGGEQLAIAQVFSALNFRDHIAPHRYLLPPNTARTRMYATAHTQALTQLRRHCGHSENKFGPTLPCRGQCDAATRCRQGLPFLGRIPIDPRVGATQGKQLQSSLLQRRIRSLLCPPSTARACQLSAAPKRRSSTHLRIRSRASCLRTGPHPKKRPVLATSQ